MKNLENAMINKNFKLNKCLYFIILQNILSERCHADESLRSGIIDSAGYASTVPSQ